MTAYNYLEAVTEDVRRCIGDYDARREDEDAADYRERLYDEMFIDNGKLIRKTNNSGGIEGGMTNGEDVILTVAMKPIPTMAKPLNSIDIKENKETKAHFERADTCAVEAMGTVALNMAAIILLNAFFDKFGGDGYIETLRNYEQRKK